MLSVLTWAASPIQKLVEKVQEKETIKAKKKLCDHIYGMQDVYEDYVQRMFVSGCIWNTREVLIALNPDKKEHYNKMFKDQDDLEFEKFKNNCIGGGSEYQRQGKIKELMVSDLYHDQLKCPEVYEKAKELSIKDDDV